MTTSRRLASYVLAIDQGTTGTTALILDQRLGVRAKVNVEFRQIFPKAGWVEHDLDDVWGSVLAAVQKALREAGLRGAEIAAIGITNQRETVALWDRRSGKPVHNAIVWQDRRTTEQCVRLKGEGREETIRAKTGLVLDPYFSATKLDWLLENVRGARAKAEAGQLAFGTVDSYLTWRLTGGAAHVTDVSNASRTLLMELRGCAWDDELLDLFRVPREVLPEIRSSSEVYGETKGVRVLPDGIPVCGIAGDQQAALFGQACFAPGDAKCTYGTGAFLLQNVGPEPVVSKHGLLTTVAWRVGGETHYALEGSAFIAGAAVQWLRDQLKIIEKASDVEALARTVKDSEDVVFVPALVGMGAPHWRPGARGLISGITRGTSAGHLARALLEGIAFQIHDLVEAMVQDAGRKVPAFRVDGGASANDLLMQFQADILGVPVERPRMIETTALGAAFLAGLAAGVWSSREEIAKSFKVGKRFEPKMKQDERERHLAKWRRAVQSA
ncbi:glycerol kinase GlpK [Anaeromyxobacter diazotrophicus]|uniref:Glycerol kinase n=1 Tax=Anaeromyxobacter diazotrophicus TaxID=2590199 RepID=A0A7I9VRQ3_9BACT|nr:glycerol kinase GlpK [Anaeromyxobacter diazotrophicus]GEJ59112.1 glycerol kinase [Anaeromyxobacter diazotrophicus]